MSAKERLDDRIMGLKVRKLIEQKGKCKVCGKPIGLDAQLAHRIPQRKWCINHFGERVIHHSMNMVLVCSLDCNCAAEINPITLQADILAVRILKEIERGNA